MKIFGLVVLLVVGAYSQDDEELPLPLPPILNDDIVGAEPPINGDDIIDALPPACSIAADVQFIVDSSSTIGGENFQYVKAFLAEVIFGLDISKDLTRVGVNRYTSWVDSTFFLNTVWNNKTAMLSYVDNMPYYGRGTRTGNALRVTYDHSLMDYNGWRGNIEPTAVILITDGISQDTGTIAYYARKLHSKATRVIAIGVGDGVNTDELSLIASPGDDVILVNYFSDLFFKVGSVIEKICEMAGDINECLDKEKNFCSQVCANNMNGFFCECFPGYSMIDDRQCENVNECDIDNGGCSHSCTDTDGSFTCTCPEGTVLANDGLNCVEDSCYTGHECDHVCTNVVGGENEAAYFCTCHAGFKLAEDQLSCIDIDECVHNNGGCQHTCNNVDGGYICSCNDDFFLLEDGKSCGISCYTCENAASNEECMNTTVCQKNEQSCQTETRSDNGTMTISKRCKQTEACVNNAAQNPRDAWSPSQCSMQGNVSVCRCCCHGSNCNNAEDCFDNTRTGLADPFDGVECIPSEFIPIAESSPQATISCSGARPGDRCDIICPSGYQPINEPQLLCTHTPRTFEAIWVPAEVVGCEDQNECLINNGGCSHICINTIGSYECACPPDGNSCSTQKNDLFFIVDSSSSIGAENFDLILNFVVNVALNGNPDSTVGYGENGLQVGLMTYNGEPYVGFDFNQIGSLDDLAIALDAISYSGTGTRTAQAINFAVDTRFGSLQGRRHNEPLTVVIITDGRSQDRVDIPTASSKLHAAADKVKVIGVGDVSIRELLILANGLRSDVSILNSFAELETITVNTCAQPEGDYYLTGDNKTCDINECEVGNGGCSDNCFNTLDGFFCTCASTDDVLAEDGKTCIADICLQTNGGCSQGCLNSFDGPFCFCTDGYMLDSDGVSCVEYDECADENGGCSHGCINNDPGFDCACPPGLALDSDLSTCINDSCFVAWRQCDHTCVNIPGIYDEDGDSGYVCLCNEGYTLSPDGHNCTETDECQISNGGCEYDCVNTDGGYFCTCPIGFTLREDGKTCAISCYTCQNALSNDECVLQECSPGMDSCFASIRMRDNATLITKGCQQKTACINNMLQNGREMGEGPSQCNIMGLNVKCDCCCFESDCNQDSCPYETQEPGCQGFETENVVLHGLQALNNQVLPGGTATLTCPAGYAPSMGGEGQQQLLCVYNEADGTSAWNGDINGFDSCVEINECEINNGGCVSPATCVNYPGGYECQCPDDYDDYVLFFGVICERDECADIDQGGCSHNCTNTIGGYECFCPGEMALVTDQRTCKYDECVDDNGGCSEVCFNTLAGIACGCLDEGYEVGDDGTTCQDIDECKLDHGCQSGCINLPGHYECTCPEGLRLNEDGFTCRDDPCYPNNGDCDQLCVITQDSYECQCHEGFRFQDDNTCVDIDECAINNGSCTHNCTNFPGGYECSCPPGLALDKDGKTCGRACITCHGAESNEECNAQGYMVCPVDSESCENEVRVRNGTKLIYKQCKQAAACNNNFLQNPRQSWQVTQCNGGDIDNICRCCCSGHMCNSAERPCAAKSECYIEKADVAFIIDSSNSIKFDNFQKIKGFAKSVLVSYKLGEGQVHTAIMRYNGDNFIITTFKDNNEFDEVFDSIDSITYNGIGRHTGSALQFAADNLLSVEAGRRGDVPLVVVVVTDGESSDDVALGAQMLADTGAGVISIGVGNVNEEEIRTISQTAIFGATYKDLEGDIIDQVTELGCADLDECSVSNGGCSDECVNTAGSYFCRCNQDGHVLGTDGRTCVLNILDEIDGGRALTDKCRVNGINVCSHTCDNTPILSNGTVLSEVTCGCPDGYVLSADYHTCEDFDECSTSPCSHGCVNTEGGFFCECPPTHYMDSETQDCILRASEADCSIGYSAVGQSCMRMSSLVENYANAAAVCASEGARLASPSDQGLVNNIHRFAEGAPVWSGLDQKIETGVWKNSDGSVNHDDIIGAGDCGMVALSSNNIAVLNAANCTEQAGFVCEKPRSNGLVLFSRTWNQGAQGSLYYPYGVETVTVNFPARVSNVVSWFCTVKSTTSKTAVFSQNDIERTGGLGKCEFVVTFRNNRFADYQVSVTL